MTRPNMQTVQQVYDAFRRRDIAAIFGLLDPDIVMEQSAEVPWGGIYRGHNGAREYFGKLLGAINSTMELQQFIDAGDHIVATGRTRGTVNATGRAYDVPITHVWEIRGGKVKRACFHIDNPTMLTALA